jgi:hypothetical protein
MLKSWCIPFLLPLGVMALLIAMGISFLSISHVMSTPERSVGVHRNETPSSRKRGVYNIDPERYESKEVEWNKEGCQEWPGKLSRSQSSVLKEPPSGLVVTLALALDEHSKRTGAKWHRYHLCGFVPSQRAHFIEPHGMDQLFLLAGGLVSVENVTECLNLTVARTTTASSTRLWINLDGSNLTTVEYTPPSGIGKIFLAEYEIPYPKYVVAHPEILQQVQQNKNKCKAPPSYIQGTRFYTNEFLHLSILQDYDYWIKMDLDIVFNKTVPFHMLHDMRVRGALFAHTAEYLPNGDRVCGGNISSAVQSFADDMQEKKNEAGDTPSWLKDRTWSGMCSSGVPAMRQDADRYYTNLIVGSTRFFQSEAVLEFARFLTEVQPGFHYFRWTDQAFFHFALGLFLGPDYRIFVADYTALRCFAVRNCWESGYWRENMDRCQNEGYFLHTKSFWWADKWNRNASNESLVQSDEPYTKLVHYNHNCSVANADIKAYKAKALGERPDWWVQGME